MQSIEDQCQKAKQASSPLIRLTSNDKNALLGKMADTLRHNVQHIIQENMKDIQNGKRSGLSNALIDRLTLNETRILAIADSLITIQNINDPIHETIEEWTRPNNLQIKKVRVPFGVIGIIYEARPNVTVDAIGLAIKSSNAIVLRGSSSAYHSNKVLSDLLRSVVEESGLNGDIIQLLEDTSREGVVPFVKMKKYIDLVIPRGSAGLINTVVDNATIPSIETGVGNCHVYIDKDASHDMACNISTNSATQRVSVCNSCESIVLHNDVSTETKQAIIAALLKTNVEIRGCEKTQALSDNIVPANDADWSEEYLDYIVSMKTVDSLDDAIAHINKYGSKHTESIVSSNQEAIDTFFKEIDASSVISNASTRFTDGGEFGFGAEMGISTQKLHARGPMGLKELTTYKYVITGDGQLK